MDWIIKKIASKKSLVICNGINKRFVNIRLLLLTTILLFTTLFLGINCTTFANYNVNSYQDGKTLGEDELEWFYGGGLGHAWTMDAITANIDQHPFLILNSFMQFGLSPNLDIGVDAFIPPVGCRLFLKYGLTDSLSKWGVALLPVVGYTGGDAKTVSSVIAMEFAVPISYHFSRNTSIHFGPKIYNHFFSINETNSSIKDSYFTPGFSVGFHYLFSKKDLQYFCLGCHVVYKQKISSFSGFLY